MNRHDTTNILGTRFSHVTRLFKVVSILWVRIYGISEQRVLMNCSGR